MITSVLHELRRNRILPTQAALTEALQGRGAQEGVVQGVLQICAKYPALFSFWLGNDGQLCVLLVNDVPRDLRTDAGARDGDGPSRSPFSAELLEALRGPLFDRLQGAALSLTQGRLTPSAHGAPQARPSQPSLMRLLDGCEDVPAAAGVGETVPVPQAGSGSRPLVETKEKVLRKLQAQHHREGWMLRRSALWGQGYTTVMVRNLPPTVTQSQFCEELEKSGFKGKYDYIYMPSHFQSNQSQGHAFVNFLDPEFVASFVDKWHGTRRLNATHSINICKAAVQGVKECARLWSHPRLSRIRNPEKRPVLFLGSGESTQPAAHEPQVNSGSSGGGRRSGRATARAGELPAGGST